MKNKKLILAIVALVAFVAVFLGVYLAATPKASQGSKSITVTVVHADGSTKEFQYRTDAEMLGTYLEEQGLINSEGADAGMFHTVNGEKAVWNPGDTHGAYWAFYLGEEYAMTGIYDTPITDGAVYKLVYTLG